MSRSADAVRGARRHRRARPSWPRLLGRRARGSPSCTPPPLAAAAGAAVGDACDRRRRAEAVDVPDAEAAKTRRVAAGCWYGSAGSASPAPTPSSARRGSGHRPGRLRRRDLAARRARSCRCRPRCSAWSTPRSAARPASTPPRARTWSAPSTRRPACSPTSTRWSRCRAELSRAGRGGQVRLHRRPGDPRPDRGRPGRAPTGRPTPRELIERAVRVKADVVGRGPARDRARGRSSTTGTRSATPSSGSRTTAGGTARRSRSAWSTPPSWPARPAGSARDRRAAPPAVAAVGLPTPTAATVAGAARRMRVDKKARGAALRFVVLDGLGRPDDPDRSRPGLARRRLGGSVERRRA